MSAKFLTARTQCQRSQGLQGQGVGVVNVYTDMDKTTHALFDNFEGLSKILKDNQVKQGTWVCLQTK